MTLTKIWSWFINDCPGIAFYSGNIFVTPHSARPDLHLWYSPLQQATAEQFNLSPKRETIMSLN